MADKIPLVRGLLESWNERNFDVTSDAVAEDGELVVVGTGDVFRGPDGARRYNESWAEAFPDGRITVDHILESGDAVVVEYTGRGTHTGTLATSMGEIPATGRSLTLKLCDVMEFRDDKIVRQRTYFDSGSLMTQLGVISGQPAAQQSR